MSYGHHRSPPLYYYDGDEYSDVLPPVRGGGGGGGKSKEGYVSAAAVSGGGYGGVHGHADCCPLVVDPLTFTCLLGFIFFTAFFLNTVITMDTMLNVRRRRRRRSPWETAASSVEERMEDVVQSGRRRTVVLKLRQACLVSFSLKKVKSSDNSFSLYDPLMVIVSLVARSRYLFRKGGGEGKKKHTHTSLFMFIAM